MARETTPSCAGCTARDETIAWLQQQLMELARVVARQEARIRSLEAQLNVSSRNSSKPPSSDPNRKKRLNRKAGKKAGGQKGHVGTTLKQVDKPDSLKVINVDRSREIPAGWL